jgi:hypothetical protein
MLIGINSNNVREYTLATPNVRSSATQTKNISVSTTSGTVSGLNFSDDGLKFIIALNNSFEIRSLANPYDLSYPSTLVRTISANMTTLTFSSSNNLTNWYSFNSSGSDYRITSYDITDLYSVGIGGAKTHAESGLTYFVRIK